MNVEIAERLAARRKQAGLSQEALAETRVAKSYDGDVWLDAAPSPRKVLLRMTAGVLARGAHRLEVPDLALGNADHVGVSGVNGSGKSTLIKLICRLQEISSIRPQSRLIGQNNQRTGRTVEA